MAALYNEVILDHFRNPRNYGSLSSPDIAYEDVNPLCGDRIRIELQVRNGLVTAACFRGDGCAISIAAASILTEMVVGMDLRDDTLISQERLLSRLNARIPRSRLKCACLSLEVLKVGIRIYTGGST